ncbi:MAG: glutamate 5-kinase [Ruminococcaceae bacterium]|nr:glutamate 5-kinase [Oscillospiraceae bacterium]
MNVFTEAKRVVVKIGTSTLTYETGHVNLRRMEQLVKVLAELKNSGKELIIVTSGAIGVGLGRMRIKERPKDIPSKQAAAAIGQCELMYIYDKLFSEYNLMVAQVLLTRDVIEDERRKANVVNTFDKLFDYDAIPIVNENDTVAVEEIEATFGENDTLSAIVADIVGADVLVILSDIDGLYTADPKKDPNARLISDVTEINEKIREAASGAGSKLGTGGMATKLHAAEIAMNAGVSMAIINSYNPELMYKLFDGEQVGTVFHAEKFEK